MPLDRIVTPPSKTFLLLGPRGTGKSTWLKQAFPRALTIDLLDSGRCSHEAAIRRHSGGSRMARDQVDSVWKGFAFEALLHHEVRGYAALAGKDRPISHYSVSGGFDVDFLV